MAHTVPDRTTTLHKLGRFLFRARLVYTLPMKRVFVSVTSALLLLAVAVAAQKRPVVGQAAPLFTAKTVDGHTVSLADLRGKIVLLNIWASH